MFNIIKEKKSFVCYGTLELELRYVNGKYTENEMNGLPLAVVCDKHLHEYLWLLLPDRWPAKPGTQQHLHLHQLPEIEMLDKLTEKPLSDSECKVSSVLITRINMFCYQSHKISEYLSSNNLYFQNTAESRSKNCIWML